MVIVKKYVILIILLFSYLYAGSTEVYFSPDDHPTQRLVSLISQAKQHICAAIYMLTDMEIAQALANAKKNRHVEVQVIVDKASIESEFGKIDILRQQNIPVYVFTGGSTHGASVKFLSKPGGALMHNKFALIDGNIVWTGSFNWTKNANMRNQENVIVLYDSQICAKFKKQFDIIKNRCDEFHSAFEKKMRTPQETESFLVFIKNWVCDFLESITRIFN